MSQFLVAFGAKVQTRSTEPFGGTFPLSGSIEMMELYC